MRRHVRTFRHVTEITQITLIHHFDVVGFCYAIDLQCFGFINKVKKRWERVTKTDAPATTMADVEYPLEFSIK